MMFNHIHHRGVNACITTLEGRVASCLGDRKALYVQLGNLLEDS